MEKELEFKTHVGEFWKCRTEDVKEIFPSLMAGMNELFSHFNYAVRVDNPNKEKDKFDYHVWGITEKTAQWLARQCNMDINGQVPSGFLSEGELDGSLEMTKRTRDFDNQVVTHLVDEPKEALRLGLNKYFKDFRTGEIRGAS